MSIKDNLNTVAGNLAQQGSAAAILLVLPYLVSVPEYGQIIFLTTLMSFIGFADLGIAYVYGRKMPSIYQRNEAIEISGWNSTVLRYRVYASVVFGTLMAALYQLRYEVSLIAVLLLLFMILSVAVAFFNASVTARGRFEISRNFTVIYSVARLLVLPGATVAGVLGWMGAQLVAVAALFRSSVLRSELKAAWRAPEKTDWKLIKDNMSEALSLGVITTLWLQLLASARTFASFIYPDAEIAKYGLSNAVYQGIGMLIVAAFVPQTVKVYRMLVQDRAAALNYTVNTILIFQVLVLIPALLLVPASLWFFGRFFPDYGVTLEILRPMMLSIAFYPAIVTTGVLLTGTGRHRLYLGLVLAAVVINVALVFLLLGAHDIAATSVAQMATLSIYALMQIAVMIALFRREIKRIYLLAVPVVVCLAVPAYDLHLKSMTH